MSKGKSLKSIEVALPEVQAVSGTSLRLRSLGMSNGRSEKSCWDGGADSKSFVTKVYLDFTPVISKTD